MSDAVDGVATEAPAEEWCVYEIHEEGLDACPFYIGISNDVERRMKQHESCRESAVYPHVRALDHLGTHCEQTILGRFPTREAALLFEAVHIALRPGLRNRDIVECRTRLNLPAEFWEMLGISHMMMLEEAYAARKNDRTSPAADMGGKQ